LFTFCILTFYFWGVKGGQVSGIRSQESGSSAKSKNLLFAGHDLQKSTGKARYFFAKTTIKPDCGSSPQ
jgi:hypothetical protein